MEQDFNDVVSALLKVLTWRTHLVVQQAREQIRLSAEKKRTVKSGCSGRQSPMF